MYILCAFVDVYIVTINILISIHDLCQHTGYCDFLCVLFPAMIGFFSYPPPSDLLWLPSTLLSERAWLTPGTAHFWYRGRGLVGALLRLPYTPPLCNDNFYLLTWNLMYQTVYFWLLLKLTALKFSRETKCACVSPRDGRSSEDEVLYVNWIEIPHVFVSATFGAHSDKPHCQQTCILLFLHQIGILFSAGQGSESGYFGPWQICKYLLYGRERCGPPVTRFKPIGEYT